MPWWMNQSGDAKPFFALRRWASVAVQRLRRVGPEQPAGVNPPQADLAPVTIQPTQSTQPSTPSAAPGTQAVLAFDTDEVAAPELLPTLEEPPPKARRATFTRQVFDFDGERYGFNLYVPAQAATVDALNARLPLLVMLHGCQQDAPDFARGTGMNELAATTPFMVLYPEQPAKANQMRCWNWFDTAHQGRSAGEPAMLAALTRLIIARYPVDEARVYIAGLSAGGAMAAIVATHYPELFAALGVHSGLPTGAAKDVMSAFQAMRLGGQHRKLAGSPAREHPMPTIVFHGSADTTVHPDNSLSIVQAATAALTASGLALEHNEALLASPSDNESLRQAKRSVYRAGDGRSYVEHWSVDGSPHAWAGGNPAGSYTDPQAPGASAAMLAFFLQHSR
jgi:poly(hydroxyalkanoate) depolymerase family esterase